MRNLFRSLRLVLPLAALVAAVPAVRADDVADVVEKARAFVGRDRDLDAVRSIKFVGTIADDRGGTGTIEIHFQKPLFHRISIAVGGAQDIKALDDYEGWSHLRNAEGQWRFRVLDPVEVARLRAIVFENLNFYKGLERIGGKIKVTGRETIDTVDCVRVEFIHPEDSTFVRFFDRKTGRLVMTRTEGGTEIREEGELRQANVRFPKRVVTSNEVEETPEGGGEPKKVTRKTTITFDTITVNEEFPRTLFATPLFTNMP